MMHGFNDSVMMNVSVLIFFYSSTYIEVFLQTLSSSSLSELLIWMT